MKRRGHCLSPVALLAVNAFFVAGGLQSPQRGALGCSPTKARAVHSALYALATSPSCSPSASWRYGRIHDAGRRRQTTVRTSSGAAGTWAGDQPRRIRGSPHTIVLFAATSSSVKWLKDISIAAGTPHPGPILVRLGASCAPSSGHGPFRGGSSFVGL